MAKGSKLKKRPERPGRRRDFKYRIRFKYQGKIYELDRERVTQDASGRYQFTQAGLTENVDMLEHEDNVELAAHRALSSRLGITAIAQRFPNADLRIVGHIDGYQDPGGDEHDPVDEVDVYLGDVDEAGFKQLAELAKPTDAEKDEEKDAACDVFAIADDGTVVPVAASSDAAKQAEKDVRAYADKRVKDWLAVEAQVIPAYARDALFSTVALAKLSRRSALPTLAQVDQNPKHCAQWYNEVILTERNRLSQKKSTSASAFTSDEEDQLAYLDGLIAKMPNSGQPLSSGDLGNPALLQALRGIYRNVYQEREKALAFVHQGGVYSRATIKAIEACRDAMKVLAAGPKTPETQRQHLEKERELFALQQKLVREDYSGAITAPVTVPVAAPVTVPVAATAVTQAKVGSYNPFALMAHQRHLADPTAPPLNDLIAADDDDPLLTQWRLDENAGGRDRNHYASLDRQGKPVVALAAQHGAGVASPQSYFDVQAQVRQERRAILEQRAAFGRAHPSLQAVMPSLNPYDWATDVYFQGPLAAIGQRNPAVSRADLERYVYEAAPRMTLIANRVTPSIIHAALKLVNVGVAFPNWPDTNKHHWPTTKDGQPLPLKALFDKNIVQRDLIANTLNDLTGKFQDSAVRLFISQHGKAYFKHLMDLPVERAMFELQRDYFAWRAQAFRAARFGRAVPVPVDALLSKLDSDHDKISSLTRTQLSQLARDASDPHLVAIAEYVKVQPDSNLALSNLQRQLHARLVFANISSLAGLYDPLNIQALNSGSPVLNLKGLPSGVNQNVVVADVKRQFHVGAMIKLAEPYRDLAAKLRELNALIDREPGLREILRNARIRIPALNTRLPEDAARLQMQLYNLQVDMQNFQTALSTQPALATLDAKQRQVVTRVADGLKDLTGKNQPLLARAQGDSGILQQHIDGLIDLASNHGPDEPAAYAQLTAAVSARPLSGSGLSILSAANANGALPRLPATVSALCVSAIKDLRDAVDLVQNSATGVYHFHALPGMPKTLSEFSNFALMLDRANQILAQITAGVDLAEKKYEDYRQKLQDEMESKCYQRVFDPMGGYTLKPLPGMAATIVKYQNELRHLDVYRQLTLDEAKKTLKAERGHLKAIRKDLDAVRGSKTFSAYALHQQLVADAKQTGTANAGIQMHARHQLLAMSGHAGTADGVQAVIHAQHPTDFDQHLDTREADALYEHQDAFDAARQAQHEQEQRFVKDPTLADRIHEEQRRKRREEIMAADADALMAWRNGVPPFKEIVEVLKTVNATGARVMGALKSIYEALPSTVDLKGGPGALIAALIVLLLLALLAGVTKLITHFGLKKRLDNAARNFAMISMAQNGGKVNLTELRKQLRDNKLFKIPAINGNGSLMPYTEEMIDDVLLSTAKHAWNMGADVEDIIGLRDLPKAHQDRFDDHARPPSQRQLPRFRAASKVGAEEREYFRMGEALRRYGHAPQRADYYTQKGYDLAQRYFDAGMKTHRVNQRLGVRNGMATGPGGTDRAGMDPLEAMRNMRPGSVR